MKKEDKQERLPLHNNIQFIRCPNSDLYYAYMGDKLIATIDYNLLSVNLGPINVPAKKVKV
jgi:hypothetical protein